MLPARALDPAPAAVPVPAPDLAAAYTVWLAATGRGNKAYALGARSFLARWPDPQGWAAEPLAVRLAARSHTRPLLNFLMLHGHLRPGYDYLLERKLSALGRELPASPLGPDIDRFLAAATELGYAKRARLGMASQVAARLLIQSGRPIEALATADLAAVDPGLASLADLDRQRHIEPWLRAVAEARHRHHGTPLSASERRSRILTVGRMLDDIAEWGWAQAPARRLVFDRDVPRLPRPLPRYLPPDADRQLTRALEASPNRLYADALLLARATGLRVGELVDLELDGVHEVAGQGAWLKVPLGKLDTERMVPIDDETLDLVDRIVAGRSPGRPLRHPRTGQLVEFLLTHQGRRVSVYALRDELHRAAAAAGLDPVTPHQLRHTYATALVNAGVSLQALMALLGHVSAEMSLRYGRLFDATVRADYERALTLAKERLGPVLPGASHSRGTPVELHTNWRDAPLIKARLAGGYCVRTAAQGVCPYTNICEHCPNFRSDVTFLPILAAQRADAKALAADAKARGWGEEAARHQRLVQRLDLIMGHAQAR